MIFTIHVVNLSGNVVRSIGLKEYIEGINEGKYQIVKHIIHQGYLDEESEIEVIERTRDTFDLIKAWTTHNSPKIKDRLGDRCVVTPMYNKGLLRIVLKNRIYENPCDYGEVLDILKIKTNSNTPAIVVDDSIIINMTKIIQNGNTYLV